MSKKLIRTTLPDKKKRASLARPSARPPVTDDFWYLSRPVTSFTGLDVNEQTAMNYSAVFACVRVLAETVASLPLFVYQRIDKGREKAPDYPLYSLLHDSPNPEMTSLQYREALMVHLLLWGNHYSEIAGNVGGGIDSLWPLDPSKMIPKPNEANELIYQYMLPGGEPKPFRKEQILHVAGLGYNGVVGLSPIGHMIQSIGLGMAAEQFGARFFSGDGSPSGVMEHPGQLGETSRKNLEKSYRAAHSGLTNVQRLLVLEEGMKFNKIGIPNDEAQFLESRYFQLEEIARIYRVPLHLVGDLRRATFSNIEHLSIDFAIHSIRPWCVRIEQAISMKLFSNEDRKKYFAEHLIDGLLRGDLQSRYTAYGIGIDKGFLNRNEVRAWENLNPREGGEVFVETPPGGPVNKGL